MFGMQIGSSIGSVAGGIYNFAQGVDFSMPEYEAPAGVKWNKILAAKNSAGYGRQEPKQIHSQKIDFALSTDVEKIEHILLSIRNTQVRNSENIDMRHIFQNFPTSEGQSIDLAGITNIVGARMPVHINLGTFDNIKIGLYRKTIGQNYFEGVFVNGYHKSGTWQNMKFSGYLGNIWKMSIHYQHNAPTIIFNYSFQ